MKTKSAFIRLQKHQVACISDRRRQSALTEAQSAELELMRKDNQLAATPFLASKHWEEVVDIFENILIRDGITMEVQEFNLVFHVWPSAIKDCTVMSVGSIGVTKLA